MVIETEGDLKQTMNGATTTAPGAVEDAYWYHTIELPGGVVTPGRWDLRSCMPRLPFPESLAGKRCLDIATSDGFFAFEMERRGAEEVVGIAVDDPADWDWPEPKPSHETLDGMGWGTGRGFEVAREALGSQVERKSMSIYDVSPETVGTFDFVFIGSLLVHLRDPAGALAAVRSVVEGDLLSFEPISLPLSLMHPRTGAAALDPEHRPVWWTPNVAGYKTLLRKGGFRIVDSGGPVFVARGKGLERRPTPVRKLNVRRLASGAIVSAVGVPQAWALLRKES